MRRWLLVLLLVLLPLQFSWAAVAIYCGHETGVAADHVGHHNHAPHDHGGKAAGPGGEGKTDGSSTNASSFDCGHCHSYSVSMVHVPSLIEPLPLDGAPSGRGDTSWAEHVPAQPERPKWDRLV
jgi:hypothetical protein